MGKKVMFFESGVCGEQVDCNSIQCMKCQGSVHCSCSDVTKQMNLLSRGYFFVCR